MKAILEFNLPEDQHDHNLALHGAAWMQVCHELGQWLRNKGKYEGVKKVDVNLVRQKLAEFMAEEGLEFE